MLISTALLLDSIIRNSVCTPANLPCRRVEVGYKKLQVKNYNVLKYPEKRCKENILSISIFENQWVR
jgi:hypothetical protein